MKKYCKNIDLLNEEFLEECVRACLFSKWKRKDVKAFIKKLTGFSYEKIQEIYDEGNRELFFPYFIEYLKNCLITQELSFKPIWYKDKIDKSNGKLRRIGIQHISQQLFDYVAVFGMKDLLKRIGDFQCASIPDKGIRSGKQFIEKWVKEDKVKWFVKLDFKKCFPNIPKDKLFVFLDKYIVNKQLLWLIHSLVNTFEEGLSIGSYLSQYLCNLYLSQLYHEIQEKMVPEGLVLHSVFYMDDILLLGDSAKHLLTAAKRCEKYVEEVMGMKLKSNWGIQQFTNRNPVDMMGFRFYKDHTTMRKWIFIRSRRAFKRIHYKPTVACAKRCIAYHSYFKYTNSHAVALKFSEAMGMIAAKQALKKEDE